MPQERCCKAHISLLRYCVTEERRSAQRTRIKKQSAAMLEEMFVMEESKKEKCPWVGRAKADCICYCYCCSSMSPTSTLRLIMLHDHKLVNLVLHTGLSSADCGHPAP